jgi:hypothetical protein
MSFIIDVQAMKFTAGVLRGRIIKSGLIKKVEMEAKKAKRSKKGKRGRDFRFFAFFASTLIPIQRSRL